MARSPFKKTRVWTSRLTKSDSGFSTSLWPRPYTVMVSRQRPWPIVPCSPQRYVLLSRILRMCYGPILLVWARPLWYVGTQLLIRGPTAPWSSTVIILRSKIILRLPLFMMPYRWRWCSDRRRRLPWSLRCWHCRGLCLTSCSSSLARHWASVSLGLCLDNWCFSYSSQSLTCRFTAGGFLCDSSNWRDSSLLAFRASANCCRTSSSSLSH